MEGLFAVGGERPREETEAEGPAAATVERVAQAFRTAAPTLPAAGEIVRAAAARAGSLAGQTEGPGAAELWAASFVADSIAGLSLEHDWTRDDVQRVIASVADVVAVPPRLLALSTYQRLLSERHAFELPPALALQTQVGFFLAFAPATSASVWTAAARGAPRCVVHVGSGPVTRRMRVAARETLLTGASAGESGRAVVSSVPVSRWERPYAALVYRAPHERRHEARVYADELARHLVVLIERDMVLAENEERERVLVESSERRLLRLGLDLHDGPIQEVVALGHEVRLFRSQLERVLGRNEHGQLLLGRVGDLEARLVALDRELRDVSRSLESPTILRTPLSELLENEVRAIRAQGGRDVRLTLGGNFEVLTASQRIALLRIVQEALQNAADHSRAATIAVSVSVGRHHLEAEITDDGRGFDVERTLVQAARAGRLGLVGMSERIRLLGGRFEIESRPGGPTTVRATIPKWKPDDGSAGPKD